MGVECDVEKSWLFCQAPGDEADTERRKAPQLPGLGLEPFLIAVATTQDPEAAGLADSPCQPAAGDRVPCGSRIGCLIPRSWVSGVVIGMAPPLSTQTLVQNTIL